MFFKGSKDLVGFQKPKELIVPLMPLRDIVVFPYMVVPLFVGRDKSIKALEFAMANDKNILLSAQKKAKTDDPAEEDIYTIGTLATILQLLRLPDGTVKVLVEGKKRARLKEFLPSKDCFMVKAEDIVEVSEDDAETEAIIRGCLKAFETYVKFNKNIPPEMIMSVSSIDDPCRLADTIAAHLSIKISDKQSILEIANPAHRLEKLYA
ncbi:MAG: LON peptidase substrate-binding domain-containing protein, partial [Deltaproteobacteria bacterium]|nr:LON peptidase substrate-binding domain-containing protein [Deltaproteobacteria bacterium]